MAERPAWSIKDGVVVCQSFQLAWNGGFAISQKQKNICNLHEAINDSYGETALEVSSKGLDLIGKSLSAFNLKLNGIHLENIFQSSKKYELGGPYLDLLSVTPKESKQDERHRTSGRLVAFVKDGIEWSLEPKTAFYDYIYVRALMQNFAQYLDLSDYEWFTDIEFNPNRSLNCQARSAAIYKLIQQKNLFSVLKDNKSWIQFHKEYVRG